MQTITSFDQILALPVDERRTLGDQIAYAYGQSTLVVMPPQYTDYGSNEGTYQWDSTSGRCGRCDSRYCKAVCMAGAAGYVYVTGRGWIDWFKIAARVAEIAETGSLNIEFYPRSFHPIDIPDLPVEELNLNPS